MKLTKSKLKQIIKEELNKTLQEQSLQQQIGLPHGMFTPADLISALTAVREKPEVLANVDAGELESMISRYIQKKGTPEEKEQLKTLRDDVLRAAGHEVRQGRTSYERSRERRTGHKDVAAKQSTAATVAADLARLKDRSTGGW
jgi:hypothetical protein